MFILGMLHTDHTSSNFFIIQRQQDMETYLDYLNLQATGSYINEERDNL